MLHIILCYVLVVGEMTVVDEEFWWWENALPIHAGTSETLLPNTKALSEKLSNFFALNPCQHCSIL